MREQPVVVEQRVLIARVGLEPNISFSHSPGHMPSKQFCAQQCLRHTAAGDWVDKAGRIPKQNRTRRHGRTGAAGEGGHTPKRSQPFCSLQTRAEHRLLLQPAVQRSLCPTYNGLPIRKPCDENLAPWQGGHIQFVTATHKDFDPGWLDLTRGEAEVSPQADPLTTGRRTIEAELAPQRGMQPVGSDDQWRPPLLSLDEETGDPPAPPKWRFHLNTGPSCYTWSCCRSGK